MAIYREASRLCSIPHSFISPQDIDSDRRRSIEGESSRKLIEETASSKARRSSLDMPRMR